MQMTQSAPCAVNNKARCGMGRRRTAFCFFSLAAGTPLSAVLAQPAAQIASGADVKPENLTLSSGVNVWDGKFGAVTDTNITTEIISARYTLGAIRLFAVIPNMRIRSDGTFFTGLGGTPLFVAPNIRPLRRVRQGLGDLTLGAAYMVPGAESRGFDLQISGQVKIPTASAQSQLSTGKADYAGQIEISRIFGRVTPSLSATYRVFGDTGPWRFKNGLDIVTGASYSITPTALVFVNYEFAQRSSRFIGNSHEILAGASTPIFNRRLRLSGYLSKGLSSGAANISAGAAVSFRI
jgi:hypothetical protein